MKRYWSWAAGRSRRKLLRVGIPANAKERRSESPFHEIIGTRRSLEAECAAAEPHLEVADYAQIQRGIGIPDVVVVRYAEPGGVRFKADMARRVVVDAQAEHRRHDVLCPGRRQVDDVAGAGVDDWVAVGVKVILGRVKRRVHLGKLHLPERLQTKLAATYRVWPRQVLIREF